MKGKGLFVNPRVPRTFAKERRSWYLKLCVPLFLIVIFSFSSCARVQGKLLVMEGNFFTSRGFYTEAIASYLRALSREEAVPYAEYGLASVYFALGENSVALERYQAALLSLAELGQADTELRYRVYYNVGIIYFEMGEYYAAVHSFRNALKVDGSRIEAKRNLELSLLVLNRVSTPQADDIAEAEGEGGEGFGRDNSALFEYLRQMEREQWRNRVWASEDDWYGPDF